MTTAISATPRNAPAKGIAYMLAASATLTIMDAGIKWLTATYPVPQIGFMRYAVGMVVATALAARLGGVATLRTQRLGGHALRSLFNLATMLTFYYALDALPLTDSIAIGYAAPLFMTALSVPLLGERVGWRRRLPRRSHRRPAFRDRHQHRCALGARRRPVLRAHPRDLASAQHDR